MSGLVKGGGSYIYLNIKEGKLIHKNKQGEVETYDGVGGRIDKVEFVKDEYEGKPYEKANIYISHVDQNFILQMRVDSGYFRNFCNALKNGDVKQETFIKPAYSKDSNGKSVATCFVSQNGKYLKHAHTKDNPGDLPQLEKVTFKGETKYDNAKQLEYWKNWLSKAVGENVPPVPEATEDETDLPF
jgi:hypothetical protein